MDFIAKAFMQDSDKGVGNDQIMSSRNGKEFFFMGKLCEEIRQFIFSQERISIVDLPSLLNADLKHVQEAIKRIISQESTSGKIILIHHDSELITQ